MRRHGAPFGGERKCTGKPASCARRWGGRWAREAERAGFWRPPGPSPAEVLGGASARGGPRKGPGAGRRGGGGGGGASGSPLQQSRLDSGRVPPRWGRREHGQTGAGCRDGQAAWPWAGEGERRGAGGFVSGAEGRGTAFTEGLFGFHVREQHPAAHHWAPKRLPAGGRVPPAESQPPLALPLLPASSLSRAAVPLPEGAWAALPPKGPLVATAAGPPFKGPRRAGGPCVEHLPAGVKCTEASLLPAVTVATVNPGGDETAPHPTGVPQAGRPRLGLVPGGSSAGAHGGWRAAAHVAAATASLDTPGHPAARAAASSAKTHFISQSVSLS